MRNNCLACGDGGGDKGDDDIAFGAAAIDDEVPVLGEGGVAFWLLPVMCEAEAALLAKGSAALPRKNESASRTLASKYATNDAPR